jgi:hypothetical protein
MQRRNTDGGKLPRRDWIVSPCGYRGVLQCGVVALAALTRASTSRASMTWRADFVSCMKRSTGSPTHAGRASTDCRAQALGVVIRFLSSRAN